MRIGTGIIVAAIGAILAFAVRDTISGIDLRMIGIILMVAGVLGVLLEVILFAPRRRQTSIRTTENSTMAPAVAAPVVMKDVPAVAAPVLPDVQDGRHQEVVSHTVTEEQR
jgi:hypothetical protein